MTDELLTTKEHTEAHGDKIKGYRKLSEEEIEIINSIKEQGKNLEILVDAVDAFDPDPRWLAMAKTDLQVGIMKLVRSIAKPQGF